MVGSIIMSSLTPRLDKLDKNYIINGNFDFWQRGSSSVAAVQFNYYADRWFNQSGANTSATISRQSSGLADSIYCLRWTAGSTSSQFNFQQALESIFVNPLKGKYVTFSIKARVNSGNVRTYAATAFKNATADTKSGGSWSQIGISTSTVLTTSFQTLKVTVLIPNDGSANGLRFGFQDGGTGLAADYVEITDAMLVVSNNGEDIVPDYFVGAGRNYLEELRLCQRYFERWDASRPGFFPGYSVNTTVTYIVIPYAAEKRVSPAISRDLTGGLLWNNGGSTIAVTTHGGLGSANTIAAQMFPQVAGGLATGGGIQYSFSSTAFLNLDAEL